MEYVRPPVFFPVPAFFSGIISHAQLVIPVSELFDPKTHWNSSRILSANGPLKLTIFLENKHARIPIQDIRISYRENWQRVVWHSIASAYAHAPYFDEWEEELQYILMQKEVFYLDYISRILQWTCDKLLFPLQVVHDTQAVFDENISVPVINPLRYPQVFRHKFGFTENLGVLDLLLNCGPEAALYIRRT